MFAVMDGHGQHGHFVSDYVKQELVIQIEHISKYYNFNDEKANSSKPQFSIRRSSNEMSSIDTLNLTKTLKNSRNKSKVMNSIEIGSRRELLISGEKSRPVSKSITREQSRNIFNTESKTSDA